MIRTIWLLVGLLLPSLGLAKVVKVAGNYKVNSIKTVAEGHVLVDFVAAEPTGKFDRLRLASDHVHVGVKVNDELRIAAEVIDDQPGGISSIRQVLIFLPSAQGSTPIWMLSHTARPNDLGGAKLLDMHSPSADFRIF